MIGLNNRGSIIIDCYATGDVSGKYKVGGLVGDNTWPSYGGYIARCYSTGHVTGNGGGLVGYNYMGGITYDSYWDTQTSGKTSSKGGTGKTNALMMQQTTFAGWDFDEIWDIDEGQSYPYFMEPRVLEGLEIVGLNEVAENSNTAYKAMANYDIGSPKDVTDSADWSVEPNDIASIAAGLLTTEMIDLPEDVTITAQYSEGDVNESDEKDVSIFAICPSGNALEFDGVDDFVAVPDNPALSPKHITIAAWIYPENLSHNVQIVGKWRMYNIGGEYIFDNKNNNDALRFAATFGGNNFIPIYSDDAVLHTNAWQHVAVTWDGLNCVFYVNGENAGEDNSAAGDLPDSDNSVYIGRNYNWGSGGPRPFDGKIDEVTIFNRALSAEEIQTLMHTRPDTDDSNLVAYWDFDEGSGQIAYDSAGGNDGVLGDANTPDGSDPNWTDSIPPVGICTMEELFGRNINQALDIKLDILEQLEEALGKETAGQYILEQFLNDGDSNIWEKRDILESKRMVRSAVQNEEKAGINVDQSIDKLDDALDTLGIE